VVEAREKVVAAARAFKASHGQGEWMGESARCMFAAVDELDALTPAPIVDSGGASVVGSPETSAQAARLIIPRSGTVRSRILFEIAACGGGKLTDEMLERRLRLLHTTASSARNWLVDKGWLEDSRERALTSSRCKAVLWQLTPAARNKLRERT